MKIKKINRFSVKVFDAVLKLLPQITSNVNLPTQQYFKEFLKSKNSHFFVAELENEQIIGMLTIGFYNIPSGTKVWIEDVVIDESYRAKGYGRELLLFAISFVNLTDAKTIRLTSRPQRVAANQLYQKIGFVKSETNVYKYLLK